MRREPIDATRFEDRQREEAGIGLYYYNARWYDAKLGRFAQADIVLRKPGKTVSTDRYEYVSNNPIRLIDPSGMAYDDYLWWVYYNDVTNNLAESGGSVNGLSKLSALEMMQTHEWMTKGVSFEGNWQVEDFRLVIQGLEMIDAALGGNAEDWLNLDNGLTILWETGCQEGFYNDGVITLRGGLGIATPEDTLYIFIHEAGHRIAETTGLGGYSWWRMNVPGWNYSSDLDYWSFLGEGQSFTGYGMTKPSDDFAEMFVWHILTASYTKFKVDIPETISTWHTQEPDPLRKIIIQNYFSGQPSSRGKSKRHGR